MINKVILQVYYVMYCLIRVKVPIFKMCPFEPKRDEVTGECRKLHNEELHNLYSSPSIIRIMKSRRMRRAGHVSRMGRRGTRISCWWESQKERGH
jgi:hypothetical protein